jgi:hypothetical protein
MARGIGGEQRLAVGVVGELELSRIAVGAIGQSCPQQSAADDELPAGLGVGVSRGAAKLFVREQLFEFRFGA